MFFRSVVYDGQIGLLFDVFCRKRVLFDLFPIIQFFPLGARRLRGTLLSLVYVKKLFVVNLAVFEELLSVLMKLFLPDLISHFEDFLVEHDFTLGAEQLIDEIGGGGLEALVDGEFLFLHGI